MGELKRLVVRSLPLTLKMISIDLPASKSMSNRLLIIRALSGNKIEIGGLSDADDTLLLAEVLDSEEEEKWLGHAGTALRFATAWAAITPGQRILRGSERLSQRPMKTLIDALRGCGADIVCTDREGFAPLRINGMKLKGSRFRIDGTESSQFLSALLLTAPYFDGPSRFEMPADQVSLPYIDMTVLLMQKAGAKVSNEGGIISVESGGYSDSAFTVEPDWSAAAYIYSLVCLKPGLRIFLCSLSSNSVQGDKEVAELFAHFGVETEFTEAGALLTNSGKGLAISQDSTRFFGTSSSGLKKIDLVRFPDLAQPIAATACGLKQPLRLEGLQTLRLKETDRISALQNELAKCGAVTEAGDDFLEIKSFKKIEGIPRIRTYSDHRMAMSFAVLAAVFGEVEIENPEVVSKSFPGFWDEVGKVFEVG